MKKFKIQDLTLYWLPVIAYAGLIYYVSSVSETPDIGFEIPYIDKLLHTIEYLLFGFLLFRVFQVYCIKNKAVTYTIVTGFIYGVSDEVHQMFVLLREPSFFDWIFDGIGIIIGIIVYLYVKNNIQNPSFNKYL